jgi:ABC-2 type transport system permease protein
MTPQRILIRHIWRTVFANRAVRWLFLAVSGLALYAAWTGWVALRSQTDMRAHYQHEARQDWLANPDKHPHRMAHYGHFAFRPKAPLSGFDFGMDSFLGNAIFLEAHRQNAVNFSEAGFSTGLLRFGEISLAMVLQVLFPLLIIFLGFGSIATDRENGTLRLLLIQGVSWPQLVLGNSLGLLAVVGTLFGPVLLLAGALWALAANGTAPADGLARLGLLAFFYATYLLVCCLLVVGVSARSQTAKTALVTLIGGWLMLTIVLPRAAQAVGSYRYEVPSKARFQAAIQADVSKQGDSHNPDDPHYKALKDSLLRANGVESVQALPFNYSGYVMAEGEKISAEIYNRHFAGLQETFDRQNRFTRALAWLNPFVAIRNLSMALAGSDYATYVDFQQQAEAYRYALAQKMNDLQIKLISNRKLKPTEKSYSIDRSYWQDVPDFTYRPRPVSAVFADEGLSMLALTFWAGLLLGAVFINKRSFRV